MTFEKETSRKHFKTTNPSYPMAMTYFQPLNLCIFALVSDIAIYSVQQGG
jgi:hypothetical protein